MEAVPLHVAIIPDGNRRWAQEKGLNNSEGHKASAKSSKVMSLFKEAKGLGIEYVSLWLFSTENWKRDSKEIDKLFSLLRKVLKEFRKKFKQEKIRFRHLGRKDRIPKDVLRDLEVLEEETKDFEGFNVQACLDYGGRDEILRAVNKVLSSRVKSVDEGDFVKYLDSFDIPDPDLVIRTSGENRTSGFMPFQSVYSELYFSGVHFPDFDSNELRKAVEEFSRRKRNFGK